MPLKTGKRGAGGKLTGAGKDERVVITSGEMSRKSVVLSGACPFSWLHLVVPQILYQSSRPIHLNVHIEFDPRKVQDLLTCYIWRHCTVYWQHLMLGSSLLQSTAGFFPSSNFQPFSALGQQTSSCRYPYIVTIHSAR